ncbi:SLA1 homology domain 1, SHD1 [Neorhodopirellula lusitana]|uniref:SLA1 homology domain 1, SHD1 n=1 Tax=Neorhodopirellula lusitana TaxID=445327 RepID=A0ABY1QBT7_9BACT|nr:SHD1 domain-containing protein [Neorhodopirellula lusitana]SMP62907.1 SLA1 homology domain 1, SHD1 [Neorhodopirellula lusitana]
MRLVFLCTVAIIANSLISYSTIAETWVDESGRFRVEAEFFGYDLEGGKLVLKKNDGNLVRVPIEKLSNESKSEAKRLWLADMPEPVSSWDGTTISVGDNPTIEQTLAAITELSKTADPGGVWELMPASFRRDADEVASLFAKSVDDQTWNHAVEVIEKLHRLVGEKSEFIINSSFQTSSKEKPAIAEVLKSVTPLIREVLDSDLCDQDAMKSFDGNRFFQSQYPQIKRRVLEALRVYEETGTHSFRQADRKFFYTLISVEGDTATVKMSALQEDKEQTFRRIDDRWLPADLIDQWPDQTAKARTILESLQTPEGKQSIAKVRQFIAMASGMLDPLLNANTQAEFDQASSSLVAMVPMVMGAIKSK